MEFKTKELHLPHCETQAIYGGRGKPGCIYTPGGLQGTYGSTRESGLADRLASVGLFVCWDRRFAASASGPFSLQSFESNAFDLLHVMDAFKMERPNLMGASFGASIMLTLAYWMPERVNRLVLVHPARHAKPTGAEQASGQLEKCHDMIVSHGLERALQMDDFCYRLPPDRDDFAGGRLADMDPEEFEVCVEETFRRTGTHRCPVLGMPAAMLRHIEHESLIFAGDDETHPRAAAEALGRLLPNARISKIPPTIGPKLKAEEIEEAVAFLRG